MAVFFFDIQDGDGLHRDCTGDEFENFAEARQHCQCLLADIARHEMPDGDLHVVSCEMRDDANGEAIYKGEITYRGSLKSSRYAD